MRRTRNLAELLDDPSARAYEKRIDRRAGDAHRGPDLLVGEAAELTQDECLALPRGKGGDGARDIGQIGSPGDDVRGVESTAGRVLVQRRRTSRASHAPALVPCDRRKPGRGIAGLRSAEQAAMRVQERLLGCILGSLRIPEMRATDGEDHRRELVEECSDPLSGSILAASGGTETERA